MLYWPGMRRQAGELASLFAQMRRSGFVVQKVSAPYDVGPLPSEPTSHAHHEVMHLDTPASNWWIGLSLGAAVAHIVCSTICGEKRPARLTLINPFADRMELSQIRGFDLGDQWRLCPDRHGLPPGTIVDLVLSSRDEHVPPEQGLRLHALWGNQRSRVVWADSDHAISDSTEQCRVAELLLQSP